MAEAYMENLGKEFELLRKQKITDAQLNEYIEQLLPLDEDATAVQNKNITRIREISQSVIMMRPTCSVQALTHTALSMRCQTLPHTAAL